METRAFSKLRAHAIRGAVQCLRHNDEPAARSDLRSIVDYHGPTPSGRQRKILLDACHSQQLLMDKQ